MGLSRSCWNGKSALQPEEITSKGTRVLRVYYQSKCPSEKSLENYLMILVYIYIYIAIFTNPSARAGYDTRSIFKRSLTGLNSEFSFS